MAEKVLGNLNIFTQHHFTQHHGSSRLALTFA